MPGDDFSTVSIIEVGPDNIDEAHICCAIGNTPQGKARAATKKAWMRKVFADGYRFWRLDERGKALIEATPGQNAWCPVAAETWLFIDCFWVSGKFKGHGVARRLLAQAEACAREAGLAGLAAVASDKERPFLSDGAFYAHLGFEVCDTAPPCYQLLVRPLSGATGTGAARPAFLPAAKNPPVDGENGFSAKGAMVYYTNHCPHTEELAGRLAAIAAVRGVPFTARRLESAAEAQKAPNPFPTWAFYWDGDFVTNEIFSENKFVKFLESC